MLVRIFEYRPSIFGLIRLEGLPLSSGKFPRLLLHLLRSPLKAPGDLFYHSDQWSSTTNFVIQRVERLPVESTFARFAPHGEQRTIKLGCLIVYY